MGSSILPNRALEYRRNARICLSIASRTADEAVRSDLLELASHWLRLAERAENTRPPDLTYALARWPEPRNNR